MTDENTVRENPEEEAKNSSGAAPEFGDDSEVLTGDDEDQADSGDGDLSAGISALALTLETAPVENQPPALNFPVVAFGASAGGLPAFQEILTNLAPETGMAFVLVTHLAPDQRSYLSEIVERYTKMPVLSVEEGLRPKPNHLYVLLPNQTLTLHEGRFQVEPLSPVERPHRTIDTFFFSLAADQKNHSIGVVLSGADADGALGLKSIKGEGGISIVQSPESATHSDMPRSSIALDHVDLVVPPAQIAAELNRLAEQFTRPDVRTLGEGFTAPKDDQTYQKILLMVRGVDLRQYKPETIRRRIARRMILLRKERLADYFRHLQNTPEELRLLQEDVLINVTRFFRDQGLWDSIRTNLLPGLFQNRPQGRPVRIWCAGCSTGEEAYSLAITVLEYLSQHGLDSPLQIFGTDVSEQSIEAARIAIYPEALTADVSPERIRRYFVKVERGYQVSKRVRDACIFARQNLANDPPFSHIDILSCRNVMIYFNQPLQRQMMLTFHYALETGGYMILGMSEGLREYGEVFSTVDRKHKIYMKTGAHLPNRYEPPRNFALPHMPRNPNAPATQMDSSIWPELELQRAADRMVMARFGPAGLIIDERMNILQSRGQTAPYFEIAPGPVNWNLQRVLNEGIVTEVRAVAQRAIAENVPTSTTIDLLDEETGLKQVQVDVLPITSASARPRCFLILFQPLGGKDTDAKPMEQAAQSQLTSDEKDRMIAQLRQDLISTRFHLQSMIEERDARHQELVSANEEIQSANEELQSTNEELETTKEELQSANEELQTVNDELQQRNNILTQTGNDLTNLLNSVNIPLLMLTSDLQIRQFTPPMQRLLNVRSADIGRSISEIRLQLSVENIAPLLNDVLESLGTREMEVQDREGRWHLLRVRPYRTTDNKIEGLVVVLVDIDQLRRSQQHLMDARDFARSVVESVPVPIVVLNRNSTIRSANTAFRELTEMKGGELEGLSLPDLVKHLWGLEEIGERLEALADSDPGTTLELEHESTTQQKKTLLIKSQALSTDGSRVLLLMIEDITLRRTAELLSTKQKTALEDEIQVASRRLTRTEGELRGLTGHLFTAQEEERQYVARELHDDISQRLSVLRMLLDEISISEQRKADYERLQTARQQVDSLNNDLRTISHRLHPAILNELGLSESLKALVHEFGEYENMPATYSKKNVPDDLPQQAATSVYRIAQEALRNVSKHAGKTHVKVTLSGAQNLLRLKVEDFGVGFDQDADAWSGGLGMISMQERARLAGGQLKVQSALGQGTTVVVEVPLRA
ncbi:MAG: CheR family methyltransferase [Terracidiphilus sp.]